MGFQFSPLLPIAPDMRHLTRPAIFGRAAADLQDFESILIFGDADGAVAKLGINIFFPGIRRLEDMAVRVNRTGIWKTLNLAHKVPSLLKECVEAFPLY